MSGKGLAPRAWGGTPGGGEETQLGARGDSPAAAGALSDIARAAAADKVGHGTLATMTSRRGRHSCRKAKRADKNRPRGEAKAAAVTRRAGAGRGPRGLGDGSGEAEKGAASGTGRGPLRPRRTRRCCTCASHPPSLEIRSIERERECLARSAPFEDDVTPVKPQKAALLWKAGKGEMVGRFRGHDDRTARRAGEGQLSVALGGGRSCWWL